MSPSPIRVGFVGLSKSGWASVALAPSLLQPSIADRYSITAVSTTSEASATASAKKQSEALGHPVKPYYGSTAKIAADPDIDLVVVAVKAPQHKTAVLPVIDAGKNVFLEWPVGASLSETVEIAAAARKKGVRTIAGLQGRHTPVVQKVKEILDTGKIGKVLSVSIIALAPRELLFWGPQVAAKNAYTLDAASGATLLDIAVGHQLDVFTYLLGDFASVTATTATHYPTAVLTDDARQPTAATASQTASDQVAFTGILRSGAVSSITWRGGLASGKGRRQLLWEIDGEDGSIRLEEDAVSGAFIHIRDPKLFVNGEKVEVEPAVGGMVGHLAGAWKEYLKGEGVGSHATFEDAVRNHKVLDAIKRSAEEGKRIVL